MAGSSQNDCYSGSDLDTKGTALLYLWAACCPHHLPPPADNGREKSSKGKDGLFTTHHPPCALSPFPPISSLPFTDLGGQRMEDVVQGSSVSISALSCYPLSSESSSIFLINCKLSKWFPFHHLCCKAINSPDTVSAPYSVLCAEKMATVLHPPCVPAPCKVILQSFPSRARVYFSSLESGLACDLLQPTDFSRCDCHFKANLKKPYVRSLLEPWLAWRMRYMHNRGEGSVLRPPVTNQLPANLAPD